MEIKIESRSGICEFSANSLDPILFSGLSAGLTLPYDCATGTCGMCKARVKSGTVDVIWPEAPAFSKIQRDKGDILMCQSRPTSDCVLRVPANVVFADAAKAPRYGTGTIESPILLTADVMQFDVQLREPMRCDAGQFVVLATESLQGGRAYSMVNYAAAMSKLEFVIKKKPGGGVSEWFFSGDRTGDG